MTAAELENIQDNDESEDEYGDGYYDRIDQEGILPSNHLRACHSCLVTIVNGQFYGYWQDVLNHRLASGRFISRMDPEIMCTESSPQIGRLSR